MVTKKKSGWMSLLLCACALAVVVGIFFIQTLFWVQVGPIEFAPPPDFVSRGANDADAQNALIEGKRMTVASSVNEGFEKTETETETEIPDYDVRTLARLIQEDDPSPLVALMKHENREVRVATAKGIASLPFRLQMRDLWFQASEEDQDFVEATFYEALVDAVEHDKGTVTVLMILSSIGELPGADEKTFEILAWTSDNYPSPDIRDIAMLFLTEMAPESDQMADVLDNRAKDPSFRVRLHAFGYRFKVMGLDYPL